MVAAMSDTHDLSFLEKKARPTDQPYATLTGVMFGGRAEYRLLKKNTKFLEGQYASILVAAKTPATLPGFDIGDTYVADLVHLDLSEVDGRSPTPEQYREWAELRGHHTGGPGHGAVISMNEIMGGATP